MTGHANLVLQPMRDALMSYWDERRENICRGRKKRRNDEEEDEKIERLGRQTEGGRRKSMKGKGIR